MKNDCPTKTWLQTPVVVPWDTANILGTQLVQDPSIAPDGAGVLTQGLFPSGQLYTYIWESPWFDLRPDLKSIDGQPRLGVPISDKNARLYLHASSSSFPDPTFNVAFPNVYLRQEQLFAWTREEYQPYSLDSTQQPSVIPGIGVGMGPWVNISSTMFPATFGLSLNATEAVFSPPGTSSGGGGNTPIRYWKTYVQFWQFRPGSDAADTASRPLTLQATVY